MQSRRWPVLLAAFLLCTVEWLAVSAVVSRVLLAQAKSGVDRARELVREGDVAGALAEGDKVKKRTSAASWLTSGPAWAAAGVIPGVKGARDLISDVNDLTHQALPPLTHAAGLLKGGSLTKGGGTIDLSVLRTAGTDVTQAQASLATLRAKLAHLDAGPVSGARDSVLAAIDRLGEDLATADKATRIGPAMLGADGKRTYLLLFQNTSELRGSGGLIGSWAEVTATNGHLEMTRSGSDQELIDATKPYVIDPDFDARWGGKGAEQYWIESASTPHFPWTAQVVSKLWQAQSGETLDGVIGVDTQGAAQLLRVTGPLTLANGQVLTQDNFTTYLQRELYVAYPNAGDVEARQKVLSDVQHQIFDRITGGHDPGALIGALGDAEGQRHLRIWSAHPDEEAVLSGTLLAGELPSDPGPFAQVIDNDEGHNKTGGFLATDITWQGQSCDQVGADGTRLTSVTMKVHNTITSHYFSPYLAGVEALPPPPGTPYGRNVSDLSFYATVGATEPQVLVDGKPVAAVADTERGHPVVDVELTTDPGVTHTVEVSWREPAAGHVHLLRVPGFVDAPQTHVAVASCP